MADLDIPATFPWLRSDPALLTGEPPGKVSGVHGSRWEQVFIEWLRGATQDIANATFVSDKGEDEVFAEFLEMSYPATKSARKDELVAEFATAYGMFRHDVGRIQGAVAAQVKKMRDDAKAAGEDVPSERDARKKVGRETAKAVVQKEMKAQSATLGNINVALVANLQLKTYQVTAMQQFKNALNGFGSAKWDVVPENPDENSTDDKVVASPEKEQALNALNEAGTDMFAAYGRVSAAIAQITAFDGADIPEKAATELTESLLEFGQSIARQSDSVGQAARLFGKWARRTTRKFIRDNFASIYPGVAIGFFALRTVAMAGAAVASSFPGYGNLIGTAVKVAEQEIEMAAVYITGWYGGASTEQQEKYALREFQITAEHRDGFFDRANKAKQAVDGYAKKLQNTAVNKLDAGVRKVATGVVGRTKADDALRHLGEVAEVLSPLAEAAGISLPDPVEMLADGTPILGIVKNVGDVFFDFAALYVAVNSELVVREGVSQDDLDLMAKLIKAPPQNEGFALFERGKPVVLERVEFPLVYVRSAGVGFSLNLETNFVAIVDEDLISAEILAQAQLWAKNPPNDDNGLRFHGAVYTPHWDKWQLDLKASANSPFHATLEGVHSTPSENRPVTLKVLVDLGVDEVAITWTDYVPRPEGLDAILDFNAGPPADGKLAALSADHLKTRFAGTAVVFGPDQYTLSGTGAITFEPPEDWTSLSFTMAGVHADGRQATLHLEYAPRQVVRVISAEVTDAAGAVKADLDAADPLVQADAAKKATPDAQAKLAAARARLAADQEASAKQEAKEAKAQAEAAPKNAKKAAETLAHAQKEVAAATKKVATTDTAAKAAQAKSAADPAPHLKADAAAKAETAKLAVQELDDAKAAVTEAVTAKDLADAAVPAAKAAAEAKAAAVEKATAARKSADAESKVKAKEKSAADAKAKIAEAAKVKAAKAKGAEAAALKAAVQIPKVKLGALADFIS